MSRRVLFTLFFVILAAGGIHALLAEPAARDKVPPFTITAKTMELDLNRRPMVLEYKGDVKLTSPRNSLNMKCNLMTTNAKSEKEISEVTATGNVDVTMVNPGKDKEDPGQNIHATAEKIHYDMKGRILRMMTDKGIAPKVVVTDLKTNEPYTISGTEIMYDMVTRKIISNGPRMSGGEEE